MQQRIQGMSLRVIRNLEIFHLLAMLADRYHACGITPLLARANILQIRETAGNKSVTSHPTTPHLAMRTKKEEISCV